MYFNLRNKFVKRKKIRKTFINLLNFSMGRCGIRSCRFSQRFKQISKHELAISLAVRKQSKLYTNEIKSSCFEICLKRCEKRQERIPHRPMEKFNKFIKVFRIFFRFTNLFRKLKYI